jgi:hypothetical protein
VHLKQSLVTSKDVTQWLKSNECPDPIKKFSSELPVSLKDDCTPSSKLITLVKIVENILLEDKDKKDVDRRKVLVYCVWPGLTKIVEKYFAFHGIALLCISSSTSPSTRAESIASFQQDGYHLTKDGTPSWVCMISSTLNAGVNMTRASILIEVVSTSICSHEDVTKPYPQDIPWSYQEATQVEGRIYRIGQTRPVEIIQLVAKYTVDDILIELSNTKGALMELFSNDLEADTEEIEKDLPFVSKSAPNKQKFSSDQGSNARRDLGSRPRVQRLMRLYADHLTKKSTRETPEAEQEVANAVSFHAILDKALFVEQKVAERFTGSTT